MKSRLINLKRGFSLIEFLVGVFIFSLVFGMTIISVKLASGKVASSQNKTVSIELRNAIETISQKMNNANAHKTIRNFLGDEDEREIYGFSVIEPSPPNPPNNILAIATSGNQDSCAFIAVIEKRLYMHENNCQTAVPNIDTIKNSNPLTSEKIKVTVFDIAQKSLMTSSSSQAPFLTLTIHAEDPSDSNIKLTYQTSFEMDYLTYKKLKLE